MKKVAIVTTLYPKDSEETIKVTSFAIRDLVVGVKENFKDIQIEKIIIPVNLVEWRKGKINKKRILYLDDIKIEIIPIFNLPKIGKFFQFHNNKKLFDTIDLVVAHLYEGAKLAYYSKVSYIYIVHNSDYFRIKQNHILFKNAKNIYTRSWALKKKIEPYYGVKGVVFSGIEKDLIIKRDFYRKVYTFITVSLLQKIKNIDKIIKALSRLPKELEWKYIIIGDGEEKDNLIKLIRKFKLEQKIKLLGFKKREECIYYMRRADVFLMPSIPETFGLAYLESMASGCIVLGAKEWGVDGLIRDGENGYLVNPYDKKELLKVLKKLLLENHSGMYKKSFKTIQTITQDKAVENYYKIIKDNL